MFDFLNRYIFWRRAAAIERLQIEQRRLSIEAARLRIETRHLELAEAQAATLAKAQDSAREATGALLPLFQAMVRGDKAALKQLAEGSKE